MTVRVRSRFHRTGRRSLPVLASVAAALGWKLAIDALKNLRRADFDIDLGQPYFEIVSEFMVFIALAADRIAHRELDAAGRVEFTTALARRMAEMVEDNRDMLLGAASPGACQQNFLDRFNRRSAEYADFAYAADGPDFGFRRCFAACLGAALPQKDQLWIVDQAMDIEAPAALRALEKTLAGLLGAA